MSDETKAVARKFYKVIDGGGVSGFDAICSPELRGHAGAGADLDQLKASTEGFINSFPDLRPDVRHFVCEGDLVSTWVSYEGTHKEDFAGVAGTGRPVKFAAWDLFRIDGGKIVEITQYCDLFTILNQIGALPTASPPDAYEEIDKPAS